MKSGYRSYAGETSMAYAFATDASTMGYGKDAGFAPVFNRSAAPVSGGGTRTGIDSAINGG